MICNALKYMMASRDNKPVEIATNCFSSFKVGFVIFFDPEAPSKPEIVGICKSCADNNIFKMLMEEYTNLSKERTKLYGKLRKDRAIARKNDVHYTDLITPKISAIKERMEHIRWHKCRYEACDMDIDNLRTKIYSATHYSENGKIRQIYYFCSRKHWNIIRARCGLKVISRQNGHTSLEDFTGD